MQRIVSVLVSATPVASRNNRDAMYGRGNINAVERADVFFAYALDLLETIITCESFVQPYLQRFIVAFSSRSSIMIWNKQ